MHYIHERPIPEERRTHAYGRERPVNVGRYERIASMIGGGLLMLSGLRRRSFGGLLAAATGGLLAYRGRTGYCPVYERTGIDTTPRAAAKGIHLKRSITVDRPIDEVYRYWKDFENLPRFMTHITSVEYRGDGITHWVAREGRFELEWDARITEDEPDRRIAWRSLRGADVRNEGSVEFREAPGGRGTEVHVELRYTPPGGETAMMLAPLFRMVSNRQLGDELRRFKQMIETGEIATSRRRPDLPAKRAVEGPESGRSTGPEIGHEGETPTSPEGAP